MRSSCLSRAKIWETQGVEGVLFFSSAFSNSMKSK